MSYANGTQFYNLPQTVGSDKRDWFDTNSAFAAVDAALHAAATGQAADAEAISAINTSLAAAESDIASLQTASTSQASEISALQATVASQGTAITDVRQDAEDMISAYNEGAASVSTHAYTIGDYFIYNDVLYKATAAIAIGDTIVPNTNCSATNVTSEIMVINEDIDELKSDLAGSHTTVSGTGYKVNCSKNGNNISIECAIAQLSTSTIGEVIATIPSEYRPKAQEIRSVIGYNNSQVTLAYFTITTNGEIEANVVLTGADFNFIMLYSLS